MSSLLVAAIFVTVFLTSILSGIFGMAGGMIVMGLLAWTLPVHHAMAFHAITQFFGNLSRLALLYRHLNTRVYWPYLAGLVLVFGLFVLVSFVPDKMVIFLLMGLSPFARYALPKKSAIDCARPRHAFLCGAVVSAFQMTSGVIGPLVDVFFQSGLQNGMSRQENVANKALFQITAHVFKFIYFSMIVVPLSVSMAGVSAGFCAGLIVLSVAGTYAGSLILERMKDRHFYIGTNIMLFAISATYLIKAAVLMAERWF